MWTKEQKKQYARERYRKTHPKRKKRTQEDILAYQRKKNWQKNLIKYGINEETYQILLETQNGKCKICATEDQRKLSVDHDHITGRVRGLLCRACNLGLGNFKDKIVLLVKAIEYLNK